MNSAFLLREVKKASEIEQCLKENESHLLKLGHYLSGMIFYNGEWFWGVDRLHYLENRLKKLNYANSPAIPIFSKQNELLLKKELQFKDNSRIVVKMWWSFRSPYSQIVLNSIFKIADFYGITLKIQPVLPMVMRGYTVPYSKRIYIMTDTAREAKHHHVKISKVSDPVGVATERAMVIYFAVASTLGKERAFMKAWAESVWSEGINASKSNGLKYIVEKASLPWQMCETALQSPNTNDAWQNIVNNNKEELLALNLWGVPSFSVEGKGCTWGQDRLWLVEKMVVELINERNVQK